MDQYNKKSNNDDYLNFLRKEKFFSDHIIDNSRSMISIINRSYVYEKVNSTFCDAHRGLAESIVGKSLADVWGPETFRKYIKENVDKCFLGSTVRYEASFSIPQAGKRYFEVIFRPVQVEEGEITHLLAETFDVTDLKVSEKIAIELEEEFRRFETNLPIGFIRCLPDGTIIHVNRAFLRIMDCREENLIHNKNLRNYYAEEGIFNLHLDQLFDGKPKNFGRVPLISWKGNEIVCRINGFMAMKETGAPSYIDFAIEDSSRELMLENRLLQAQKLETIGALAGGIAHDFNNILATISGYSELLKEDLAESSASIQKIAKIQIAISKARSLTNQILTFSRQVEQEKVPVNVYEVLKETIGFIKLSVSPNVTIKSRISLKNAPVFADPTQLFRVFMNLMTNAVQSFEDENGIISVKLSVVDGTKVQSDLNKVIVADEYVLVSFRDTGKGMDPSLMGRIFEPFFTSREVGKGSGLGLSVVHGILQEIGGDILVSSEKGKGSCFNVYLPVSREYRDLQGIDGDKKRILFISGNKHEARILSLALEISGYKLLQSTDLKQLIKVISDPRTLPNLIIFMDDTDVLSGDILLKIFHDYKLKIPCILITDSNLDILEEKLVNSGIIKQHLFKPVSLKEIKNAIQLSII